MQVVISLLIIAASLVLFAYWFRYSCLLILSTQTTQDYTGVVAKASGMSLLDMQAQLEQGGGYDLAAVQRSMQADYQRVTRLLAKAPGLEAHLSASERIILRLDYRLMQLYARITARRHPDQAREALLEQCAILSHFANAAGCAGVLRA